MFSNPDFFTRGTHMRTGLSILMAAALLAGCSSGPNTPSTEAVAGKMAAQTSSTSAARPFPSQQPALPVSPAATPVTDAIAQMLGYADRVRLMSPAELGQEAARLGEASAPADQLRLSLVLSQLRQLPDLVRAQELLARVLGNAGAEAQALHPLARLLAARYGEQRRLEEQLEKQNQQVRDVQRRLEQTHERLEALKAIERSLVSRPPTAAASAPAPANRVRPAAP
jgi:hypothetical protein